MLSGREFQSDGAEKEKEPRPKYDFMTGINISEHQMILSVSMECRVLVIHRNKMEQHYEEIYK